MHTDVIATMDGESLHDTCRYDLDIERPTLKLDRMLTHVISLVAASLCLNGTLNVDVVEFQANLVTYHEFTSCFAVARQSTRRRRLTMSNSLWL